MSEALNFADPPVTETMLGVWFAPVIWDQSLLGLYRDVIRTEYPHYEDAPTIAAGPNVPFMIFPSGRGLYYAANKGQLVQIQPTMFYVNWRRLDESGQTYPRYHEQQKRFLGEWERFNRFLAGEGRPIPIVSICQVCYVNHIEIPDGGSQGSVLANVLSAEAEPSIAHLLADATDLNLTGTYMTHGGSDLSIQLASVLRAADNRKMLQVTLTSNHASTDAANTDALMAAFDAAHDDLLRAFLRVTSDAARKGWGQR